MVKKMGYSNIMIFSLSLYALRILGYSLFTKPGITFPPLSVFMGERDTCLGKGRIGLHAPGEPALETACTFLPFL
jgi:hypothetical protein